MGAQVGRRNVLPLPHWEKRKSLLIRRLAQREVIAMGITPMTRNDVLPGHSLSQCCRLPYWESLLFRRLAQRKRWRMQCTRVH